MALLQKRRMFFRNPLIIATPYKIAYKITRYHAYKITYKFTYKGSWLVDERSVPSSIEALLYGSFAKETYVFQEPTDLFPRV